MTNSANDRLTTTPSTPPAQPDTPTPAPRTLRSIAGLAATPQSLADSTLLVIDAQQAYAPTGALPLVGLEPAAEAIAQLLEGARRHDAPIVHVAHVGGQGSPFDPHDGGRFLPDVAPIGGEAIITKRLPNAFAGTTLLETLTGHDGPTASPGSPTPRPLIIVGFMTHMCVSSTARAALDLGIDTTVISDATATRDLPAADGTAEFVPAGAVHRAALAGLADRFSIVTTSVEVLAASVE